MKFRIITLSLLVLFIFACEDSTCPDVVMTAPSNLSLTQLNWSSIQLTWQDNTSSETHYQIDRKIGEGEWATSYQILAENSASFVDSNLTEIGNYTYRVLAYNNEESSGFTEASYHFVYAEVQAIYPAVEDLVFIYPEETIEYQVYLVDELDELVEHDYEVWFKLISAPEGCNINGVLFNNSDSLSVQSIAGFASIHLTAGSEEGSIIFKAYTFNSLGEELAVELVSYVDNQYPEVTVIEFLTEGQITLETNDSVTIRADLKDEFGNIVLDEYDVFVEFIGRPEGTNLNNEVYELGEYLTIPTVDGRVVFNLNSGTVSGNIGLRLYTFNRSGEEISVAKTNILVLTSAPAYCELYSGGINEGEDVGNGIWRIHLDAYLADVYGNPAPNNTSVRFWLPNSPVGAFINTEDAYVGNINDPEPGVAYNYLTYDGAYTNETIIVRIETSDYTQDFEVILPIQFPNIDIVIIPAHPAWNWEDGIEIISPRFMLKDGQNNPINNQTLMFEGTLGMPVDMGSDEDNDAFTELTSYNDEFDSNGMVIKDWVFQIDECPPAVGDEPGSIIGLINVIVEGTDLSQTFNIILTRNP